MEVKEVGSGGSKGAGSQARDESARRLSRLALVWWRAREEVRYSVMRRNTAGVGVMAFVVFGWLFDGGWCRCLRTRES